LFEPAVKEASVNISNPFTQDRLTISLLVSIQDENWRQILKLAQEKHCLSEVVTCMYTVMLGKAYELSICLEDYGRTDIVPAAKIYLPLRQRIYGVLLHEKPNATSVKEWCIESKSVPTAPTEVSIVRICNIGEPVVQGVLLNMEPATTACRCSNSK
jgi:hypothetical protein